ncbi:hypothetical protein MJO28_016588 [Puccinia striiformis f. sp. tritici]|uniref:MULE transposase domain-containing protein n=2 Tax=Puccinia striiformis TaxID=27350 RepID=A0A2S4W2T5_9BASI|nr:hypothetical protein MJO28_016588 [Puccinia striiformis f. sp. tritici]POW16049.1 hypothetical protein PSTT_01572 [Puccinia striiformis]
MTPSRHKTPNIIGIDPPSPSNFLPPSPQSNHILDRTTTNIVQPNTNHIRQTNPILQQYNNHQLLLVSSPSSTNMSTNNIPAPALTLTPEIMMQIAQLLATHKIPIPGAIQPPPPEELPAASCNNLIEKPPDSQAIQSRLDELPAASRNDLIEKLPDPCDNHLMQSSDPLDNLIESLKPLGSDLSELVSAKNHSSDRTPGSQEDDRDPINTTSTDVAPPNDLLVSRKSAGTQEVELITNVKDFDCIFGEPMDPPPSKKFLSVDSLFEFVQRWSRHHGYAVSKGSSHAGKNIYLRCDRGGVYSGKVENLVKRDSSTRKCGCLFQVKGSRSTSKGSTDPYWYLVTMHAQHNHPPSHCPSAHPSHRQLAPDEVLEVRRLSKSNVKTSQILLQLQQADSETLAVNQTINNTIHKIRQEELAGKTPIEALLNLLKQSNWLWDVDINSAGVIQNLFFAHPGSVHLARIYHHVALLDATYKTNRYKLPLLHVIGQTATNKSFAIAFCFLMYENNEGYLWAVNNLRKHVWNPDQIPPVFITDRETALRNALAEVFPASKAHLCAWHICTNITTACKKHFPSDMIAWKQFLDHWNRTATSKNIEIFEANLSELKQLISKRPAVLEYLEKNILPEKEHFVVAWASLFPHLRNLNTSRVESGHAFIKRFILNSTGDLLSVWKALSNAVDHQITHVHASIGQDSIKMLTNIPRSFINLCQKISQHAILEAQKQYERLTDLDPSDTCSKTVFIGSGIPCCHMIADILEYRGLLEPSDFHAQWHLDYNPECLIKEAPVVDLNEEMSKVHLLLSDENSSQLPRIFEQFNQILAGTHLAARIQPPNVKEQTKERPTHKKGATNSTKRLPSAHELAEAALAKEQKIVKAALAKKKRSIKPKPTKARKRVKKSVDRLSDVGAGESSDDEASDFGDLSALEDIDLYSKDVPDGADVKEGVRDHISENRPNGANVKDGVDVKEGARDNISGNQPVPVVFKKFVHNIFNPLGDGNCGFRCLAKALEYPDNGWFRVRQEMGKEVEANLAFYSKLQGGEASIKKIIAGLKVAKITAKIPLSKWLNKLDHGQVIANTYQRPIVFISTESSGTFIPSQLGPRDENAVNDVKPIPPIMGSKKLASQRSHDRGWKADLKAELNLYNQELKNKKNE